MPLLWEAVCLHGLSPLVPSLQINTKQFRTAGRVSSITVAPFIGHDGVTEWTEIRKKKKSES